ncbi:MAG: HAMP domain-containing sensor histidine kinase [Ilumatobacteraceae bacterium]|nr:HAMP domain-containing sensor histidine kinase [Ilumatobacteraceae bacterium]
MGVAQLGDERVDDVGAAGDAIEIRTNSLATFIIDELGAVELEILAGPVDDPLPRPDLTSSRIIDRVGNTFTVDGTDGGPNHRVTVGQLADGRYIALAAPLDEVRDGRPEVVGDRDALQQVFANLVTNARVHAAGSPIDIGVVCDDTHVTVTVTDEGPGMADDVAAHVFDRFYRAEESRTSSVRSSGLGLSVVAAIVDAHGGTVAVDTAIDRGSAFTVRLPITLPITVERNQG